jgi:glycosyltransferase involved in cell wall biosynthesis
MGNAVQQGDRPKVSVCCVVYNQERLIRETLDGLLQQRTRFEFEIVVGNDASTDGTVAVVREYMARHPGRIRLLDFERNAGYSANMQRTLAGCRGDYVAICDSDDVATHPDKLQRQADLLDARPEVGLVYTDFDRLEEPDGVLTRRVFATELGFPPGTAEDFLVNAWFLCPSTWMFRRRLLSSIDYAPYRVADLLILLDVSSQAKVAYLDDAMTLYRVLLKSDSHGLSFRRKVDFRKGVYKVQALFADRLQVSPAVREAMDLRYVGSGNVFWGGCLYDDPEIVAALRRYWAQLGAGRRLVFRLSRVLPLRALMLKALLALRSVALDPAWARRVPALKRLNF